MRERRKRLGILAVTTEAPGGLQTTALVTTSPLGPVTTTPGTTELSSSETPLSLTHPVPLAQATSPQAISTDALTAAQGYIIDAVSKAELFGVTVTLVDQNGNPKAPATTLGPASNTFTVYANDPDTSAILFQKSGYLDRLVYFNDITYNGEVDMTAGSSSPSYLWALLLLIPVLIASRTGKKKKVAGFEISPGQIQMILLIVAGVIGFSLLSKLLQKLGIWSGAGTKAAEQAQADPGSPWKPAYYQTAGATVTLDDASAEAAASTIHGAFTLWEDDFNAMLGVFSSLQTKGDVSYLASIFNQDYGEDLLSFLTDGGGILPWDGLSETHLKTITDLVNNLPA